MRGAASPFCVPVAGILLLQTGAMADQSAWDCRATPDGRSWQCLERGAAAPLPPYLAAPMPRSPKQSDDSPAVEPAAPGTAEAEPEAAQTGAPVADQSPPPTPPDQPTASGAAQAPVDEERPAARRPHVGRLSQVVVWPVLIVAGGGVHYSGATEDLKAFAETHNIPVAETQAGKSALP
mgnify:CR=1 FL=1